MITKKLSKFIMTMLVVTMAFVMFPMPASAAGETAVEVSTETELVAAAANGGNIVLKNGIDLTQRVEIDKETNVDLGGFTIKTSDTCANGSAFNVKDGGTLGLANGTIDGTVVVEVDSGTGVLVKDGICLVTVRSGGVANFNDANLTMLIKSKNGCCVYPFDKGKVNISAGTFKNSTTEPYQHRADFKAMVVNQANVAEQLVFITGGKFYGNDPALGDDSGLVKTFLASDCYASVPKTDYYEVDHKWGPWTKVDDKQHERHCAVDDSVVEIGDHI